jgi:hypothetical protein
VDFKGSNQNAVDFQTSSGGVLGPVSVSGGSYNPDSKPITAKTMSFFAVAVSIVGMILIFAFFHFKKKGG